MTIMTPSSASKAISVLIEMAEQGEIDPWDVKVIDVIDRFLEEIGILQDLDLAYQQRNLPKSGQAFLWASMLVRFKADTLELIGEPEPKPEAEEFFLAEEFESGDGGFVLPLRLEQHIRRRTAAPPLRKRRVTLQELIEQIEQIAVEIEQAPSQRANSNRPRPQSRKEAIDTITQLAHQENLTEMATLLDLFLRSQLSEFMNVGDSPIDLEDLLAVWTDFQQVQYPDLLVHLKEGGDSRDRVGVFWALLLLSSQSKVELSQNDFYRDLKVQIL